MATFSGASNNQNLSTKTLKRIEMSFMGKTYKFALNPETYEQSGPGKSNVTQTKAGAYFETFGRGIYEISFSGHTGLRNRTPDPESGYQKFKELKDLIESVYDNVEDGSEITNYLEFWNYTDNEYFLTYPDKIDLSRSKNQPLLYKYSVHLYCIRPMWEAETTVAVVGSPFGVEPTYDSTLSTANTTTTTNQPDPPKSETRGRTR